MGSPLLDCYKTMLEKVSGEEVDKKPELIHNNLLQIVEELQKVLKTKNVACVIDAKHLCVNSRGISDVNSSTVTSEFGGRFREKDVKREFLDYIKLETEF